MTSPLVTERTCNRCLRTLPLSMFVLDTRQPLGIRKYCKACNRERARARMSVVPEVKVCPRCRQTLPASAFARNRSATTGLQSACKSCARLATLARVQARSPLEKPCAGCGRMLSAGEFGPDRFAVDGLRARCRRCRNEAHAERRAAQRAAISEQRCSLCGQTKPLAEFPIVKRAVSGRGSWCKPCGSQRHKETYAKNREDKVWWRLLNKYGLTQEDYWALHGQQGGRCAICGTASSELKKRLAVDHCHCSGKVRGLLCSADRDEERGRNCNSGIGSLGDDLKSVLHAVAYLARFELGGTEPDDWMPHIEWILKEIHVEMTTGQEWS